MSDAANRQLVTVQGVQQGQKQAQILLPEVFVAPIRPDIVQSVHTNMNKNKRQAYGVAENAGHQHSAESWGTGRAVARIPRVSGGGNSRSGQGAFGNMCRKGRMFNPTQTWRKWHRKINTNQKRFAVASALAASAVAGLVMARGHAISQVPECPLVVDNAAESIQKTKKGIELLQGVGGYDDVKRARDSRKLRRGHGKHRNRRHVCRRGPLIVYNEDHGIVKAFRNLPGVELCQVSRLNLLQLAPGGHVGRFIIWTQSAFEQLGAVFGSTSRESTQKKGYTLPRNIMSNSDLTRIINSDEIQSKVRASIKSTKFVARKKNPLTNLGVRVKLNPYALTLRRTEAVAQERRAQGKAAAVEAARKSGKEEKKKTAADAAEAKARKAHAKRHSINYARLTQDDFLLDLKRAADKKAEEEKAKGGDKKEKKEKKPKVKAAPAAAAEGGKKKGGGDDKKGGGAGGAAPAKKAPEEKKPAPEEKKPAAAEKKPAAAEKKPAAAEKKPAEEKKAAGGDEKKAAGGKKGGEAKAAGDDKKAAGKKGGEEKKPAGEKKAAGGEKKEEKKAGGGEKKKAEGGEKKAGGGKKDKGKKGADE